MTTQDKRQPAFTDLDRMPFGKHKGEPLADVPAKYLAWLKGEMQDDYGRARWSGDKPDWIKEKIKLYNYIHNSWEAIRREIGE